MLTVVGIHAQNSEFKSETKEKTYSFEMDGITYENSVKVNTSVTQAVMTDIDDKSKVNGDRIYPPKVVTKEVWIDNDNDYEYDEYVKFNYLTEEEKDFTLVSTPSNLTVAIEEGNNTTILSHMSILKKQGSENNSAFVFTMDNGNTLELNVEDYQNLKDIKSK
mgnify:CR=1 FL=1